ncbi:MAG: ATP-binding protein [Hyphomicrobium sp.]|jgi:PAS domain S-box-containing protein
MTTTQPSKFASPSRAQATCKLVASIAALVFVSEFTIMAVLDVANLTPQALLIGLIDATLLTVISAPIVYLAVVRPFVEKAQAAELALARTLEERERDARELSAALAQQSAHKMVLDRHAIVSETNLEGRITYVNDAFLRTTGYEMHELIGENYRIVNSGLHSPQFWREMYDTMAAGNVWQGEVCNRRKDGSLYWVQATNSAIRDELGRIIGYVSVRLDITQAKVREQTLEGAQEQLLQATAKAEAASEAKTTFLSTMSHEMRTPLNGVLGALDLLSETGLDEKQKELVNIAHESSDALLVHINDVLDFSKMEAGKLDLVSEPFELARLATSVLHIVAPQAEHRNNRLISELNGELPTKLDGDRIRVRQVLLNLVSNANKFTKNGNISVRVDRVGGTRERPEIEIGVSDTGIGIPAQRLKDLFQEFSMVDSSYTRKTSGTGLGLAISKRLIESMGGTIGVESTEGVGSRFWFRVALPGIWGERSLEVVQSRATTGPVPKLRILLADDNVTNQLVASRMLASSGHDVVTVSNGLEALAAASSQRFDVLLTDISMPEMDGIEATRRIRQLPEPLSSIPIVALTANAISGDRERFLAAGMNEYLTKPLRRSDIDQCLAGMFGGKTALAQDALAPAAVAVDHAYPLLDASELERLAAETSPEVVPSVVEEYLSEMQRRLAEVLAVMGKADAEALQKVTHAIAGASAGTGARRLREHAKRIELDCMAEKAGQALALAKDLPSLMEETRNAFHVHLSGSSYDPAVANKPAA